MQTGLMIEMSVDIKKARQYLLEKEEREKQARKAELGKIMKVLQSWKNKWSSYGIKTVILYGSFSDGSHHENSDVDLAYEPEIPFENLARLMAELSRNLGRQADLRYIGELEFSDQVKEKGFKLL